MDLLQRLPCAVVLTDDAGDVVFANPEVFVLTGWAEASLLEGSLIDLLAPESRSDFQTLHVPGLLAEGHLREAFLRLLHSDGRSIAVLASGRVISGALGRQHLWTFSLAEQRNRVEASLRADVAEIQATAFSLTTQQQLLQRIADSVPAMLGYWDTDLRCQFANKNYQEWFDVPAEQLIGRKMQDILGPELFSANISQIELAISGKYQEFQRSIRRVDGDIGHLLIKYIPDKAPDGRVIGIFALVSDVTTIKVAEAELRLASIVFDNTAEGIVVTDKRHKIISVNPACCAITGYATDELVGDTWAKMKSDRLNALDAAEIVEIIEKEGQWEGEVWSRRKDGTSFLAWIAIRRIADAEDGDPCYVSVFNDFTELWQKEQRVHHLAYHDTLTDLPNRALVLKRLNEMIDVARNGHGSVSVLFLDLDGFKGINDRFGHEMGDDVLKWAAARMRNEVRMTDVVGRFGGDEFVVLLHHMHSPAEVDQIAARIVQTLSAPPDFLDRSVLIGASVGIAHHGVDGLTPAQLLQRADQAMYRHKASRKQQATSTHQFGSAI